MEQALVFASIVLGVAVAFELGNLDRVLRSKRVKWHWAQPAFALFILLSSIAYWWQAAGREGAITFAEFLPVMFQLVMLVLLAAVSLPDKVDAEGVDLAAYYQENRKYQWLLVSLYFWSIHVGYLGHVLLTSNSVRDVVLRAGPDTLFGLLFIGMIFAARWRWIAAGFAVLALSPIIWAARTLG
ncbi:hypothetical protein [Erythrobacter litoralis]|uniref:Uncharacterized protein n=1 Tax=Erythrobacter litoralis (strain HTCC2594) TaxID=314225 RepID=Q2N8Z8_ERYLH|nr:hypothetical protein [Erythrobacter litoralis]ABC63843.1 hypothetical protein ELI_08755 [Erythrobacter litoralis HTCC2594]